MTTAVAPSEVERLLRQTPSFHALDPTTQTALRDGMMKVAGFLAKDQEPPSRQLAPDLRSLRPGAVPPAGSPTGGMVPVSSSPSPSAAPAAGSTAGGSATSRVGEVARATLNAIDFPSFVASLIKGTFEAIVNASIQQMEAYATLLKNAAITVDSYMNDNVTDDTARDYLADRFDGVVSRDTQGTAPKLTLQGKPGTALPSFFADLGFNTTDDLDHERLEAEVIPATKRMLAEQRQQTLATMVLMGINRVVISDGEISAKLQFHIDASETTQMKFDQQKHTVGAGAFGGMSAQAIMVNTTSLNAQSDINVRADLVGAVTVRFRSETFPLERFADSNAIQLINSRAKVPGAAAPAQTAPTQAAPTQAPPALPALPPLAPMAARPATAPATPAPATQGYGADPWAPRGGYA